MRGEYVCFHSVIRCMPGSPPLARGILSKYGKLPKPLRITPACAGNTASGRTARIPYLDHPRLRGEYGDMSCNPQVVMGSPPLARGILNCHLQIFLINGITPACAGNTWQGDKVQPTTKDHPRLRGEYIKRGKIFSDGLGSPPLARGIPWCQIRRHFMTGITPACAGNTRFITKIRRVAWDHPRLRGEYGKVLLVRQLSIGSPPLARGIQIKLYFSFSREGITPACAGNTILTFI